MSPGGYLHTGSAPKARSPPPIDSRALSFTSAGAEKAEAAPFRGNAHVPTPCRGQLPCQAYAAVPVPLCCHGRPPQWFWSAPAHAAPRGRHGGGRPCFGKGLRARGALGEPGSRLRSHPLFSPVKLKPGPCGAVAAPDRRGVGWTRGRRARSGPVDGSSYVRGLVAGFRRDGGHWELGAWSAEALGAVFTRLPRTEIILK